MGWLPSLLRDVYGNHLLDPAAGAVETPALAAGIFMAWWLVWRP